MNVPYGNTEPAARAVAISAPAMNASLEPALNGKYKLLKSIPPVNKLIRGMNKLLTTELTNAVKAAPIIIPIARSIMLPLKAKALKSFKKFFHFSLLLDTLN